MWIVNWSGKICHKTDVFVYRNSLYRVWLYAIDLIGISGRLAFVLIKKLNK